MQTGNGTSIVDIRFLLLLTFQAVASCSRAFRASFAQGFTLDENSAGHEGFHRQRGVEPACAYPAPDTSDCLGLEQWPPYSLLLSYTSSAPQNDVGNYPRLNVSCSEISSSFHARVRGNKMQRLLLSARTLTHVQVRPCAQFKKGKKRCKGGCRSLRPFYSMKPDVDPINPDMKP